ncbi:MAG: DUF2934 domain-containing protein [Pseudomonadota bacterium]
MAERLTLKILADELEQLHTQMQELEARLERKFETGLENVLAAAKPGTHPATTSVPQAGIDAEHRQRLITEEAYLIAERRGFQGGDPSQDWVEAERRVDYRLMHSDEPGQPAAHSPKPRKKTARSAKKPGTSKKTGSKTAGSAKS